MALMSPFPPRSILLLFLLCLAPACGEETPAASGGSGVTDTHDVADIEETSIADASDVSDVGPEDVVIEPRDAPVASDRMTLKYSENSATSSFFKGIATLLRVSPWPRETVALKGV